MKIVVTGALGVLGRAIRTTITDERELVMLDQRPGRAALPFSTEAVVADIRQPSSYHQHLRDASTVIHLASLHGRDHMSRFGAADFWSVNVDGTRMLYDTAAEAGVSHVVLASSMAVYGPIPSAPQHDWVRRTEQTPTMSYDPYTLTKLVCEEIAEYHSHQSSIATTVLRFGHFTPTSVASYGFRLLFGGVDVRDAAAAVELAAISPPSGSQVRRLNIHAPSPFTDMSLERLAAGAEALIRYYYPRLAEHVERKGEDLSGLMWGRSIWPIDQARRVIDYQPEWTFERFAESFCRDDESGYGPLRWHRWGVNDLT